MTATHSLTNDYRDFQVLNLCQLVHHCEGRGPYLITQDGCDPGDPTFRHCSFVLTRRGTWLHFYLYLALPEAVRAGIAHSDTADEALHRAETLPPTVAVEDAASLQELIRESGFTPDAADLTGQALLREMRRRHESTASSQPTPPAAS